MSILHTYLKILMVFGMIIVTTLACTDSLDVTPPDEDVLTTPQVFNNVEDFRSVLAKLYAGLSLTGQTGPAGNPDIQGIDEGFSNYVRQLWVHQELPTDEAVVAWNDPGLPEYNFQTWGADNDFVLGMYSRIFFQITLTNNFIQNAQGNDNPVVQGFNAEARFLRALSYWHALDLFGGNVPFVTEDDEIGAFLPEPTNANDLFNFIESELLEIQDQLPPPGENEYGRADQGAAWTLLTKLYLNAETYVGQDRSTDAVTFAQRVIDNYTLEEEYDNLFLADNNQADGIIFPVPFDGVNTRTFGGTTFIIHAAIGEEMSASDFGVDVGWAGHRTTPEFVNNFIDISLLQESSANPNNSFPTIQMDDFPKVFVPGGYQAAAGYGSNWTPQDAPALASVKDDSIFVGYVYFDQDGAEFKITPERDWDKDFGDNNADGTLEPGGANISVADAGYYRLEVNLKDSTISTTRTEFGVIGDATLDGWDADQDMTYDVENKVWTITTPLSPGEMKFRANDAWNIDFGVENAGDSVLVRGANNIPVDLTGDALITLKLGTPPFYFSVEQTAVDSREMFFTEGQTLEIPDVRTFANGYAISKWKNITSDGLPGKDPTFPDTDFPMFRLADVLLMHAEAILRSGGDPATALVSVNRVRERAFGGPAGNITQSELTLDFILAERGRELYWEAHRRTDLIRFNRFTSSDFVWSWKGGVQEGTGTQEFLNLYPIPSSELNANPKLNQNPGY